MTNGLFDHVDLRVRSLEQASPFYLKLLPELGFTRRVNVENWLQFESVSDSSAPFFGVTESQHHVANENRIAFRARNREEVDRIALVAVEAGALNMEGPMDYDLGYRAAFFEDPCGNRLEVCYHDSAEDVEN